MIKNLSQTCFTILALVLSACLTSCDTSGKLLSNQYSAPRASIDRFSDEAGTLFRRSSNPELPGPNEPINFDQPPFLTKAYGPDSDIIQQYNFDVMPLDPAPIYVLFRQGEDSPVQGQDNIVDVIPGDPGYNDFWHIHRVSVPTDYTANTATSLADIQEAGYDIEETPRIFNCPIVPRGSTAGKRGGDDESTELDRGWYRGQVVYYFTFNEKRLTVTEFEHLPTSAAWITFSVNPDQQDWLSPGFKTEQGTNQTHNVVAATPESAGYSPLKIVTVYDNADFEMVSDLPSVQHAAVLQENATILNYPTVGMLQE